MKAEHVNPFIIAAREIFDIEIHSPVKIGKLSLDKSRFLQKDVKVCIGLTGTLKGVVIYALSSESALKMTSMMLGEPVTEVNDIVRSAMAELGNVISGIATREFEKLGIEMDISTPTVIQGEGAVIKTTTLQSLVVDLNTDVGEMIMMVGTR